MSPRPVGLLAAGAEVEAYAREGYRPSRGGRLGGCCRGLRARGLYGAQLLILAVQPSVRWMRRAASTGHGPPEEGGRQHPCRLAADPCSAPRRRDDLRHLRPPLGPQGREDPRPVREERRWVVLHVQLLFVGKPDRVPVRPASRARARQLGPPEPYRARPPSPRRARVARRAREAPRRARRPAKKKSSHPLRATASLGTTRHPGRLSPAPSSSPEDRHPPPSTRPTAARHPPRWPRRLLPGHKPPTSWPSTRAKAREPLWSRQ